MDIPLEDSGVRYDGATTGHDKHHYTDRSVLS